jgi:hypothetical protein
VAAVGWRYRNNPFSKAETWRNFYTRQHKHSCGLDLPAKALSVCILEQSGTKLGHKNLPTPPEAFLRLIPPSHKA